MLQPIYGLYVTNNGPTGSLGLPTVAGDLCSPMAITGRPSKAAWCNTRRRRWPRDPPAGFERGDSAAVALGTTLNLTLGQTVTLTATPMSPAGDPLTDRPVSWSTTNSRVITIAAGPTARRC